jgi:hypothetical protein
MKETAKTAAAARESDFNWIDSILTPLGVVLMEVLCFYPWLVSAGKWSRLFPGAAPLSPASAFLLTAAGLVCTGFLTGRRWPLVRIRLSVIACGLITIAAASGIEFALGHAPQDIFTGYEYIPVIITAGAGLYFWWRGMRWGQSGFRFDRIYRLFLFGLLGLVALALVWGTSQEKMPSLGFYIAGFFFCGLMALSLSRLQSIQEQLRAKGKEALFFSRQWASIAVTVVGIVVILGVAAASLFSSRFGEILSGLLRAASDLLVQGLYYIFIPIGFLMNAVLDFLRFIISLLQSGQAQQPVFSGNSTSPVDLTQIFNGSLPQWVEAIARWTSLALVLTGILYFLYRAIYRHAARREPADTEEIRESLWSWSTFSADLRLFMDISRQKLKGSIKVLPRSKTRSRNAEENTGLLDIREIYRRLLAKAGEIELPRSQHETPLEYAGRLGTAIPGINLQLMGITDLYDSSRYGGIEPGNAQLEEANRSWSALRDSMNKINEKPDNKAG